MERTKKFEEFDVDFDDTSQFAAWRYGDIISSITENLSEEDQVTVSEHRTWQDLGAEIRRKLFDSATNSTVRRLMSSIQPLPRSIATLNGAFISAVSPHDVQFDCLWGLVYLNLTLSYTSLDRLSKTVEWLGRLRKVIELFNRCLDLCEDLNEPRLAMIDVYDHTFTMLGASLKYLRTHSLDSEVTKAWPRLSSQFSLHLGDLDAVVKHLDDITSYSAVNVERRVKNLSMRHAPVPEAVEHAAFPCTLIPYQQNENFYGRSPELTKIADYLNPKESNDLRTYTIYGRRGVGKTEIALHYAWDNPSNYDAIFWIQCETAVSLRQSFTNVACALNLPGADRHGHHEENLLAVQKWLKLTRKRWCLIFDNEKEYLLKGYWPIGAKGSILITSRKYYNFMKDNHRRGDTVKPFNADQSYELLIRLLGEHWQSLDRKGLLRQSEITAAKTLLAKIDGLALAIQQAAVLIRNPEIGGQTIAGMLEVFNSNSKRLPERPEGERSEMIHALDTLWNMSFSVLSPNARDFLSVLAMLSPDFMLIDLFLPRKQSVLNGKLSFIKQSQRTLDDNASLLNAIKPPLALEEAIAELLDKGLIRKDNRILSVHREVQEAMNYHSIEDLQESFDAAVALVKVYEAFPKKETGETMYKEWNVAQTYIAHGVFIGEKYDEYTKPSSRAHIQSTDILTALLANCAWYLLEVADYRTCQKLVDIASSACTDKNTSRFANIRNTAGGCSFDQNNLNACRRDWELVLDILEGEFQPTDPKVGYILHNLGNLETGSHRFEEAMAYFQRAVAIRHADQSAIGELALLYLCIGRLYFFEGKYEDANKQLGVSEALFVRSVGAETHFMAHVHFMYGNIEYAQKHYRSAKRSYGDALRIALAETPIHQITAAIYYRLGCVDFALKNDDLARSHLDKAKSIAQLRSPSKDDGTIARILWKTAKVLEGDLLAGPQANALRNRAELARKNVIASGEGEDPVSTKMDMVQTLDDDGNVDQAEEDAPYDALVPIFFR